MQGQILVMLKEGVRLSVSVECRTSRKHFNERYRPTIEPAVRRCDSIEVDNHIDCFRATTFEELNLSRALLKAIAALEWNLPTPSQARAIPLVLAGRKYASGKTSASSKLA